MTKQTVLAAMFLVALLIGVPGAVAPAPGTGPGQDDAEPPAPPVIPQQARFAPFDVYIVTGETPLAAYQLEIVDGAGVIAFVGVEGGEAGQPFAEAPYYDPAALAEGERIIIAAFTTATADRLPVGRVRVATLHVRIQPGATPDWTASLTVAGDANGEAIDATIEIIQRVTTDEGSAS